MAVKDFRELRVYQLGFESASLIFRISKLFPKEEQYSLTDQVSRSSRSVCANIAEAWRKRRYPAAFISKLSDADTEATETQVWLDFAKDCEYLSDEDYKTLYDRYEHICSQLFLMMKNSKQWESTPGSKQKGTISE